MRANVSVMLMREKRAGSVMPTECDKEVLICADAVLPPEGEICNKR